VHKVFSPVAQVEEYVLSGCLERIRHGLEAIERNGWRADATHVVTAVILKHVNAPICEALRIIDFVV
jgi:hypothetical protein